MLITKDDELKNARPLIYILLNHNNFYCVMLRSSKRFDTFKSGGPKLLYHSLSLQRRKQSIKAISMREIARRKGYVFI